LVIHQTVEEEKSLNTCTVDKLEPETHEYWLKCLRKSLKGKKTKVKPYEKMM